MSLLPAWRRRECLVAALTMPATPLARAHGEPAVPVHGVQPPGAVTGGRMGNADAVPTTRGAISRPALERRE